MQVECGNTKIPGADPELSVRGRLRGQGVAGLKDIKGFSSRFAGLASGNDEHGY